MKKVNVRFTDREVAFLKRVARELGYPSFSFLLRESIRYSLALMND